MGCSASSPKSSLASAMESTPVTDFKAGDISDVGAQNDGNRILISEQVARFAAPVGAAAAVGANLHEIMEQGRKEIREAQEKLSTSLTTPIVDKELKVIESGSWLSEQKDVNRRYAPLPPIPDGKKVHRKGMAFNVD